MTSYSPLASLTASYALPTAPSFSRLVLSLQRSVGINGIVATGLAASLLVSEISRQRGT